VADARLEQKKVTCHEADAVRRRRSRAADATPTLKCVWSGLKCVWSGLFVEQLGDVCGPSRGTCVVFVGSRDVQGLGARGNPDPFYHIPCVQVAGRPQ